MNRLCPTTSECKTKSSRVRADQPIQHSFAFDVSGCEQCSNVLPELRIKADLLGIYTQSADRLRMPSVATTVVPTIPTGCLFSVSLHAGSGTPTSACALSIDSYTDVPTHVFEFTDGWTADTLGEPRDFAS